MRKPGLFLAGLGLAAGLCFGLGVTWLKARIADELRSMLDQEAKTSANCAFQSSSIEVSLLTLKALAKDAAIVCDNKPKLFFKKIRAAFNLSRLSEHIVLLSKLDLIDGFSDGFAADSPTYKFIGSLAAPIAPERDYPGRWRLKLQKLEMFRSKFWNHFSFGTIEATESALLVERTPDNNFSLFPKIKSLRLIKDSKSQAQSSALTLGSSKGEVFLADEFVELRDLMLALERNFLSISSKFNTATNQSISGQIQFGLDSSSLDLPASTEFALKGEGSISGDSNQAKLLGSFEQHKHTSKIRLGEGADLIEFKEFSGRFNLGLEKEELALELFALKATSDNLNLSLKQPLKLRASDLSGSLNLDINTLHLSKSLVLKGAKLDLNLAGNLEAPKLKLSGPLNGIEVAGYLFGPLNLDTIFAEQHLLFNLIQNDSISGLLSAAVTYSFEPKSAGLQKIEFKLSNYHPRLSTTRGNNTASSITLDGLGSLAALPGSTELNGKADMQLSFMQGAFSKFSATASLKAGVINLQIGDVGQSLDANFKFDPKSSGTGTLQVKLNDFELNPGTTEDQSCSSLTLDLKYQFNSAQVLNGQGNLDLKNVSIGCGQYAFQLEEASSLPIQDGLLKLAGINLVGSGTKLSINGNLSLQKGYDLDAKGVLNLAALLSVLPSLDELSGELQFNASLKGALDAPLFEGQASMQGGEFFVEAVGVEATNIEAKIAMHGDQWDLNTFKGELNNGLFNLAGKLHVLNPEHSEIELFLNQILIEPSNDSSLTFSGQVALQHQSSGVPLLKGALQIVNAEVQRNIDFLSLLKSSLGYLAERNRNSSAKHEAFPEVDLDLSIDSPGNIFIFTNWLGAELQAALHASGSLSQPLLSGTLKTLSGWFGFRERRFDINSGIITFKPGENEPNLEIIGEAPVRSISGDNLLVVIEASGPLTTPKITLSSDSGLTQKEILALLTSTGNLPGTTRVGDSRTGIRIGELALVRDESAFLISRFLKNLAAIDSVVLEPTYNLQRGAIEPTIIATKGLNDRTTLIGEGYFGSTVTESNLKLRFLLTDKLALSGIASSVSTEKNTAFGVDLAYTILSSTRTFLNIALSGNHFFQRSEILKGMRTGELSLLPEAEVAHLQGLLEKLYRSEGFYSSQIEINCSAAQIFCRQLDIRIEEGPRSKVEDILIEGDKLEAPIEQRLKSYIGSHNIATQKLLNDTQQQLTSLLRSEGFIESRVKTSYAPGSAPNEQILIISPKIGQPVSFIFKGNQRFSPEDFLETINLFKRRQPFGNNTINILAQNIEQLYRQNGYLFVSISSSKSEAQDQNRTIYEIQIDEGQRVPVSEISIDSGETISSERIRELVSELRPDIDESLFSASYAVEEELEVNSKALKELLIEEGFPGTKVTHQIIPDDQAQSVKILYTIETGQERLIKTLNLQGLPIMQNPPAPAELPLSALGTNRYLQSLLESLRDEGYINPQFSSNYELDTGAISIEFQPGPQTIIDSIELEGLEDLKKSVVERNLLVQAGQAWNANQVAATRRRLLKLGLFSRVEIVAADGEIDSQSEKMLIRLSGRALRSLEVGAGVNSEYGLHIFGEATDRQIFADGKSLAFRLDGYYQPDQSDISQGVASLKFTNPYLFDSEIALVEDLRYQKFDISTQEFNLDRVSLASYLFRTWEDGLSLSGGHTILQEDLSDVSEDAILSELDKGLVRLSFLSGTLGYDQRDNPLNPLRGYNLNLDYQLSMGSLASDADYYSIGGRFSFIWPLSFLGPRFSLADNIRGASSWTFSDTQAIPISQRYYLGGRGSIRGFRENSIGPRGEEGSIIGGDSLFSNNLELRYLLGENTSLLAFLDAGRIYLKGRSFPYDDMRYSSGMGVRYLSPIGPIGIDIGHALDEKEGEPSFRFHFNIGSSF